MSGQPRKLTVTRLPDPAPYARVGSLTDGEIRDGLKRAGGEWQVQLLAEARERRNWRAAVPDVATLDDDVLAVEALRLWAADPAQRPERFRECIAEQERRKGAAA